MSAENAPRIRVRKTRDGHKFPWSAYYPCCPFMNGTTGHGWRTWAGVMRQIGRHLESLHGDEA